MLFIFEAIAQFFESVSALCFNALLIFRLINYIFSRKLCVFLKNTNYFIDGILRFVTYKKVVPITCVQVARVKRDVDTRKLNMHNDSDRARWRGTL